jgi:diaminopimelate epimerase
MRLRFTKMHGAGNDYLYVNGFTTKVADPAAVSRRLSPRRKGVGADGLILVQPSKVAACRMEMYNADGSRAEMCGNGIRCVAKFAYERGLSRDNPMAIETDCGVKTIELETRDGKVVGATVDMGAPILEPDRIPVRAGGPVVTNLPIEAGGTTYFGTCVSMGNPHCVVFLPEIDGLDLQKLGPQFEHHPLFPNRVNTEFIQVLTRRELKQRTWERGSGETEACGTGACAVAVAGVLTDRSERRVVIHLLGGDLEIEWREADGHVTMRGEAVEVFDGEVDV